MRLLICEDNVMDGTFYEDVLRRAGHHVLGVAPSARIALTKAKESRPDLVLVDLHLADGPTGLTLVDDLADLGIPSIVMTKSIDALPGDSPARAVLRKPVEEDRLLETVAALRKELLG